ncbi:MAG TPA: hypothetical protein VHP58_02965 [Alphaproteobacteria bacterium]|nr:hypothetical protein [Alphaproteobacteria bacterium]
MTRSGARNLWIVLLIALLIGAIAAVTFARSLGDSIDQQNANIIASKQELENASRLSTQLAELDRLTINENTATRLEILRHLGIEQNDYDISIGAKVPRTVGSVMLSQRQIKVVANVSYHEAMALADKLYDNRKMNITGASIGQPNLSNAEVQVTIQGTLYGLEKRGGQP